MDPADGGSCPFDDEWETKMLPSPPSSEVRQRGSSPTTSNPGRSCAQLPVNDFDPGLQRRPTSDRRLFNLGSDSTRPNSSQKQPQLTQHALLCQQSEFAEVPESRLIAVDPRRPHKSLVPQLETRAISLESLVDEAKRISTGLIMLETKCVEVDTFQLQKTTKFTESSGRHWFIYIALYSMSITISCWSRGILPQATSLRNQL